jgi:hypothetical protein
LAITIVQQPQALTFVGNIPDLIVETTGLGMTVNLKIGSTVILSEYYVADSSGRARVNFRDFIDERLSLEIPTSDLFEQTKSSETYTVEITVGSDSDSFNFKAIKGGSSKLNLDCPAFLKEAWLTWQTQTKQVRDIDPEWLSYYAQTDAVVKAKGWFSGGGSETVTLHNLTAGKHYSINTTFSDLRLSFGPQPIYIDLWVENAAGVSPAYSTWQMRYVLSEDQFDYDDLFIFMNGLGGIDTIRFTGDKRSVNPMEVDAALFFDEYEVDYLVTPRLAFEKNTGFFRSKEAMLWAQDFFLNKARYIYQEEELIPIRLISPEPVTQDHILLSYDFKFGYTRQTNYLALFKKKSPLIDPIIIGPGDEPSYLPPVISDFPQQTDPSGLLFPVQKPGTPGWFFITWENLQEEILSNIPVAQHNELQGLQGGKALAGQDPAEYYHLTEEEYQKIQDLQDPAAVDGVSQTGTLDFNSPTDVDLNGWKWIIGGVEYIGGDQNITGITGTPANFNRVDYAVGDDNGDILWISGPEDPDQLIDPSIPAGTILLARVIRTPAGDNTSEVTPEDLTDFVSKSASGNQTIQSSITLSSLSDPDNPSNLIQVDTNGKIVIVRADRIGSFATRNLATGFSRLARIRTAISGGTVIRDYQFKLDILATLDNDVTQQGQLYCALINDGTGQYVSSILEVSGSLDPGVFTLVKVSATEYDLFYEHLDTTAILIYRPFALGPADRYVFYRREVIIPALPAGDQYSFVQDLLPQDGIFERGTITFDSQTSIDIDGFQWYYDGTLQTGGLEENKTIPGSPIDYNRIDALVGDNAGNYHWIQGVEDESIAIEPAIPADRILLEYIFRTPAGDNTAQPVDPDLSIYVDKVSTGNQIIQSNFGAAPLAGSFLESLYTDANGVFRKIRTDYHGVYSTVEGVGANDWSKLVTINVIGSQIRYYVALEFAGVSPAYEKGFIWIQFETNSSGDLTVNKLKVFGEINPAKLKLVRIDTFTYAVFVHHNEPGAFFKFRPQFSFGSSSVYTFHHQDGRNPLPTGDQYNFSVFGGSDQNNQIRIIEVGEENLPVNWTDSDLIDYLNTQSIVISEYETIGIQINPPPPPTGEVPTNGLLAYYKFEELSGASIIEDNFSTYNGTVVGSLTNGMPGKISNGIRSNGSPNNYFAFTGWGWGSAGSVSFWIKLDNHIPASFENALMNINGFDFMTHYPWTTNRILISILRGNRIDIGTGIIEDRTVWHMLTVTTDLTANEYKVYQNATEIYSGTAGPLTNPIGNEMQILRGGTNRGLRGMIDELGFWNRALTPTEITDLYNSGIGRTL